MYELCIVRAQQYKNKLLCAVIYLTKKGKEDE
jgi:hypothetical protein